MSLIRNSGFTASFPRLSTSSTKKIFNILFWNIRNKLPSELQEGWSQCPIPDLENAIKYYIKEFDIWPNVHHESQAVSVRLSVGGTNKT